MLGISLFLEEKEMDLVEKSIENLLEVIPPSSRFTYEMTQRKLKEENDALVDGLYMRCIENALRHQGDKSSNNVEIAACRSLEIRIKEKRESFQFNMMKHLFVS